MSLPLNVREWPFYPIEMPLDAYGQGPAKVGEDAARITYEVWDGVYDSHGSFDVLSDAINEAMRLSLAARDSQERGVAMTLDIAAMKADMEAGAPGPWRIGSVDDTVVFAADGSEIAAIDGDYNEPDLWPMMEANARRIARVPAMEETLISQAAEIERLREALEERVRVLEEALTSVLDACDQGRMIPKPGSSIGGMTIDANIRGSVYIGVPAWPIEEARAALTGSQP